MIVLLILILLVVSGLVGYLVHQSGAAPNSPPPDPEKLMQAAVDLHRIRRKLDVADLKHQERLAALRFKRELAQSREDSEE